MLKLKYKIPYTLLNLRGILKVSGRQDFDSIRKQVKIKRAAKRGNRVVRR
ncbi:MAG: hypothetical protein IT313_03880 [Anaerolineales bacterium]|nr:hypothetical protein [Anaerolineales bacterium]